MNGFQVGSIQLVHTDSRRAIFEFNGQSFSFQKFIISDGSKPVGNHFHKRKKETFFILEGGGIVALCPQNDLSKKEVFKVSAGTIIYIEQEIAHTFWLESGTVMVNFSSMPFDQNDQDLSPFILTLD